MFIGIGWVWHLMDMIPVLAVSLMGQIGPELGAAYRKARHPAVISCSAGLLNESVGHGLDFGDVAHVPPLEEDQLRQALIHSLPSGTA